MLLRLTAAVSFCLGALAAANAVCARTRVEVTVPPAPDDDAVREGDIAFFKARLEQDSTSAGDHSRLASLYLQRALQRGTEDAELLYRAGIIADAAGVTERSRELLRRAVQLRGYMSVDQLACAHTLLGVSGDAATP